MPICWVNSSKNITVFIIIDGLMSNKHNHIIIRQMLSITVIDVIKLLIMYILVFTVTYSLNIDRKINIYELLSMVVI